MLTNFLHILHRCPLDPAKAFGGKPASRPKDWQACGNSQGAFGIPGKPPFHSHPQVVLLGCKAMYPSQARASLHMFLCNFRKLHIERKMAVPDRFDFIGLEKFFARVLANGFKTTVSNLACGFFTEDEGFIHQPRERIEDINSASPYGDDAFLAANGFRGFERPATLPGGRR